MTIGTIKRITTNINLRIPVFDAPGWGREIERNFDVIDAAIFAATGLTNLAGTWTNGQSYTVQQRAVDEATNTVWICDVANTAPVSGTFATDRAARPTFWHQLFSQIQSRGAWVTGTTYVLNDLVYSSNKFAICRVASYVSGASYAADVAANNLVEILDFTPQLSAASASQAAALVSQNAASASAATALADKNTVAADKAIVAADKAIVAADKGTVAADKATVLAAQTDVTTKANGVTANVALVDQDRIDSQAAKVAAEAARDSALAAYDSFDDRYLGPKAANPTLDNDGNALLTGSIYYNSVSLEMRVYTGAAWVAAYVSGSGYLASTNNLSDLGNAATARTNLALGNIDNTSDANKPVSTAQQTALNLKANLAGPTFTGVPAAPTAAALTNTTQLATTAFVTTADNLKADLAGPALTGVPTAPTASALTNTTQLATTAFVTTADNLKANLASPTLTGTPAAPTAAASTNTTQLATTAFVMSQIPTSLNATGSAPLYAIRAWCRFNGTTPPTISASGNISSVTRTSIGFFVVNYTTAIQDTNYCVEATPGGSGMSKYVMNPTTYATGSVSLMCYDAGTLGDVTAGNFAVIR